MVPLLRKRGLAPDTLLFAWLQWSPIREPHKPQRCRIWGFVERAAQPHVRRDGQADVSSSRGVIFCFVS